MENGAGGRKVLRVTSRILFLLEVANERTIDLFWS
jgi:hypothetical protein